MPCNLALPYPHLDWKAYRLLNGRYPREDLLQELTAEHRPLLSGVFSGIHELGFLTTAIATAGDPVRQPVPLLPDPALVDRALSSCREALSNASRATVKNLRSEASRHQADE